MKQFYLTKKIYSIIQTVLVLLGLKEEAIGMSSGTKTSTVNFNARNVFGIYSFKAALAFLLFASFTSNAQIGVTVTGSTNTTPNLAASYTDFAGFVTALNAVTAVSGPVTATLAAGTSETAPVKGFNISTSTANVFNTTNTLTIVKASGAATVINAGVGTSNGNTASLDGMLYLSGMDGVTIDGLTFTDGNSASATVAMEFGIAFFKRGAGDGCNGNTVQNCIFNMQRINNAASSGPTADGSAAIEVLNSTAAAATTALTPTNGGTLATNGTNSGNRFYSNTTNGGNTGIHLGGFATTVGRDPNPNAATFLGDLDNIVGASGLGNTITNYGGGATTSPAVGIRANNQWSVKVDYNTVNNNNGGGVNHATTLRGIFLQAGVSAKASCTFNNVTVSSGATTSTLTAIDNGIGATAVSSNTIDINSNIIRFSYTTATTGVFTAILNSASAGVVNISSNNIQQTAATNYPSTGTVPVIVGGSPGGTLNVTNNTISNFNMTSATGGTLRGITASTPVGLYTVTGNTIENLSYSTATSTGSITGIYNLASATLENVNNNIIRNFSTPTTGTLNGIQNNTTSGTFQCKNNQIYNFTTTAGGAGGFSSNGITWTNAGVDISGNLIYAISSTGSTGGTGGTINGITHAGSATIYNNAIYDLSSGSTNVVITGINIGNSVTCYNNLIGDLKATKSTGLLSIAGINAGGSGTNNIFHNTVNIASSTSATTFGTSAIYYSSSTPVNNVRNNIFVNTSAAGSSGGYTAAARYTAAPTSVNFPATNNNNFYYAGTPSATSVIYGEGSTAPATNGQQTIANYLTYINTTLPVAGRESASVSEVPNFVSTTGSNPISNFLKYDTAISTQIEAGGVTGTGITTDFTGTTVRCPGGGCPGTAGNPDRGAWELNGSSPAPAVTINSIAPSATTLCSTTARLVTVTATTPSGSITGVVLNYSINGVPQTGIAMTNPSGNTWTSTIPTVSPTNAAVTWSVTATNSISLTATVTGTGYQDDPLFGSIPTATATPSTVCVGSSTVLNASLLKDGSPALSIGSGTNLTTDTTQPTAFNNRWPSYRMQLLFTAAELSASGLVAGNISAMAFNIATLGSANNNTGFTVNIGNTGLSVLGSSFSAITGFTNVFPSATYTHSASGLQTIPFSTPFAWDGTSNIIVDVAMNGANSSNNSQTFYTVVGANRMLNTETSGTGTPTLSGNRLNVVFTGKAAAAGTTVSWTDGTNSYSGNNITVTPSGTTTYNATISLSGCTANASTSVTTQALPSAPTATNSFRCGTGVVSSATVASTTGAPTPTFVWYAAPTGGVALQTGTSTSYTTSLTATTTLYVTELVGTCESSPRTPITLTINPPPTVTVDVIFGNQVNCGTGPFHVTLNATSPDPGMTYAWTSSTPGVIFNINFNSVIDFDTSVSADFVLTATPSDPSCAPIVIAYPVSVYPLPNANVTTTATGVCPGTSATIDSGLSAGNFTATCITPVSTLSTPPVSAVTLMSAGVAGVTQAVSGTDDGYWNAIPLGFTFNYFGTSYTTVNASTNGAVNFGASGTGQFSFTGGFPNVANPANMIALAARDLNAVSGTIKYWTEGSAPNRKFIIQYANIPGYVTATTGTGDNSVEAVFYETLGQVDIRVISSLNGTGGTASTNTKYIGLQDGTRTIGATAPNCSTNAQNFWNGVTTEVTTPQAWRFAPPSNYLITWSSVGPGNVLTTIGTANTLNNFSLTVSPTVTTTYDLRYTNATTGCSNIADSDRVTMTILDTVAPATTAVTSASTVCLGGSANLSLTGNVNSAGNTDGITYQWQESTDSGATWTNIAAATNATATVTPTVASSYQCLVSVCTGTAVASSSVSVGFTNNVDSTTPATRCGTGAVQLFATTSSPGATLNWYTAASGGSPVGSGSPFNVTNIPLGTTTYYVAAETTGPACSSPRVAVTATATAPAVPLTLSSGTASVCVGFSSSAVTLTSGGGFYDTYTWSPSIGVSGDEFVGWTFNPTVSGTYTLTASQTGSTLCSVTATVVVTVNSTNVQASSSLPTICLGSSVNLLATSLGGGSSSLPGTYCTADSSGGGGSNPIASVAINTLSTTTTTPVAPFTVTHPAVGAETTTLTAGQTYNLSVTSGTASIASVWFDWNRNGVFDASEWTQLWTSATSGTVSILVPVTAQPGATGMRIRTRGTGNPNADTDACSAFFSGTSEDFTVNVITDNTSANTYAWAIGSTGIGSGSTLNYTPTTLGATTYTVTATNIATGCTATATTSVTTQNAGASITTQPAATQTKCLGSTTTFTVVAAGVNLTYQWRKGTTNLTNGGTISGATSATLTVTGLVAGDAGTDYNVVVSSDCGAPITSDNAELVIVTPLAGINASATTVCSGTPVTLTENGGTATSWSWSPGGATTNAITVTPTATTNYVVTATSTVSGCTASANVTITVNQTPSAVTVVPTGLTLPYSICTGTAVQVDATGGGYTNLVTSSESFDAVSTLFTAATDSGTSTTTATLDTAIKTQGTGSVLFNTNGNTAAGTYTLNSNLDLSTSASATLTFSHIAAMEGSFASDDFGFVEYSADGGTTWTTFTSSNYTGTASSSVFSGSDVRFSTLSYTDWASTFTSATATPTNALWKNESFTVPAAALTSQFKIRFRYTKDVSVTYAGWWIDNLVLNATATVTPQYSWTASPAIPLYTDAGQTNLYTPGNFAPTVYANPTTTGTVFSATVANGTCTNNGSASVAVQPLPTFTVASQTICNGSSATLSAVSGEDNSYTWTPGPLSGASVSVSPAVTTTYQVTATSNTTVPACSSTKPTTVTVNQPGSIITQPLNQITSTGNGATFIVAGTVGVPYTYQWQIRTSTGPDVFADLSNDFIASPASGNFLGVDTATLSVNRAGSAPAVTASVYRCILTPLAPCTPLTSNTATLTVSNIGIATNPQDVSLCLPVAASPQAQFTVVTNGTGTITRALWEVSSDNFTTFTTIPLFVNATGLISSGYNGPNTTAVSGLSFSFPGGLGANYKTLNVDGINSSSFSNLRFRVRLNNTIVSQSGLLTISDPAVIATDLSTTAVPVCQFPAPVSPTVLSISTTGTVSAVVWKYATTAGASDASYSAVADGTPAGATYISSNPSAGNYSLSVATTSATPLGNYYYKAFITSTSPCSDVKSAEATISVVRPAVTVPSSTLAYCTPGLPITLSASGASTYSWNPITDLSSGTGASVTATPSAAGTYTVTGTDGNGCTNTATISVTVGTSFTVTATSAASTVCPSTPVQLNSAVVFSTPALIDPTTVGGFESGATFPLNGWTVVNGSFNNWFVGTAAGVQAGTNAAFIGTGNVATTDASVNHFYRDIAIPAGSTNISLKFYMKMAIIDNTFDFLNVYTTTTANTPVAGTLPGAGYTTVLSYTTPALSAYTLKTFTLPNALAGTTVRLVFTYKSDGASPFSAPAVDNIELTTTPNNTLTYAWSTVPSSAFTSAVANPLVTPATTTSYNLTVTANSGCSASIAAPVTINVNSAPPTYTTTTAPSQSLCAGSAVSFAVTATSSTALTYQWKKNGVNIPSATSATLTGTTTTATSTASNFTSGTYTVDIIGCTTVTATFNLQVNPLPTATVSGTTSVCQNDTAPSVTFTGAIGTAPFTFTYKLNGGANQTVTTTSGNSATVAVPTAAAGTFAYTLVSVSDVNTCSQTQTDAATVRVNATPAAPILDLVPTVCEGNALVFGASVIAPVTGVASYSLAASSGTYTPITGGTVVATSSWDDSGAAIAAPIGFSYTFNGVPYTTCNVNLNGYVSFGTTTSTTNYSPLSTLTTNEVGIISAFGRDLQGVTTTGEVRYLSTATEFIVQWTNARRYNGSTTNTESFNYQIHLVKNTNQAYIVYGNFSDAISASNGNLPQVGLRGATVADYKNVQVLSSGNWSTPAAGGSNTSTAYYNEGTVAVKPASGLTYTFSPPSAGSYAWSGPNSFSSSLQNPTISNATLAATGSYTLQITNGNGCTASSTVSATVTAQPQWYLDADGDHYYTGAAVVQCTSPGAGYTTVGLIAGGDCDDTVAGQLGVPGNQINPGHAEVCFNNVDDNCNGTKSELCAPVVVNMTPSYHNTTLASLSIAIPAVPYTYPGASNLKYRFTVTNTTTGASVADIIQTSRFVTIPGSLYSSPGTFTITASAVINDEVVPYAGNTITVFGPTIPKITLASTSCGATLATLTSTLTANQGQNATGYTFRIRDIGGSSYFTSSSPTRFVNANSFSGFPLSYSTSYLVSVQYSYIDPVTLLSTDSGYGTECTITTPGIPTISMASPTCGSTVAALNAGITATSAANATSYQFRIRLTSNVGGPYTEAAPTASRFSSLTGFGALQYNSSYSVSVRYSVGAQWSEYGPECIINTPNLPTTSLVPSQCGLLTATTLTQQLNITPYPGFPTYKVKLTEVIGEDLGASQEITVPYAYFRLNQFSIAQNGKDYNIEVAIKTGAVFGPYSTTCDVHTPAIAKGVKVPFKAVAYPNPFANNFMLDVKTTSESLVSLKVYDMVGRLIDTRNVSVSDLETTTIGDRYPSGVYNVVVSQEDSVQTVRVVKR